jgi:hypothetical protein
VESKEQEQRDSIDHPLERALNASARDILDAVSSGFRAQVDVKGKLAELYLFRALQFLAEQKVISDLHWSDKDGDPDFFLSYKGHRLSVQCKNVRAGQQYRKGENKGAYKVELQKTRGGIDPKTGEKTRLYRPEEFDVVAVCLFNQTGAWEFLYAKASDLAHHRKQPDRLEVMHPVPQQPAAPWYADLRKVLDRIDS